jgi:hypothetical protein
LSQYVVDDEAAGTITHSTAVFGDSKHSSTPSTHHQCLSSEKDFLLLHLRRCNVASLITKAVKPNTTLPAYM